MISLADSIDETIVGVITRKAAELAVFDDLLSGERTWLNGM